MFRPTCSTGEVESEDEGEVHTGQAGDQSAAQPLLWQSHWWRLDWSALPLPLPSLPHPARRVTPIYKLSPPHCTEPNRGVFVDIFGAFSNVCQPLLCPLPVLGLATNLRGQGERERIPERKLAVLWAGERMGSLVISL